MATDTSYVNEGEGCVDLPLDIYERVCPFVRQKIAWAWGVVISVKGAFIGLIETEEISDLGVERVVNGDPRLYSQVVVGLVSRMAVGLR
jgi:hypothetical protein